MAPTVTKLVGIMLSEETSDLLAAVTKKIGISKSEFVRNLVKNRLEEIKHEVLGDE